MGDRRGGCQAGIIPRDNAEVVSSGRAVGPDKVIRGAGEGAQDQRAKPRTVPPVPRPSRNGHLVTVMDLPKGEVTSLAPAEDARTVYVAYTDRIARADLATRHVDRLIGKQKTLSGFARLRWHKGSLVGARVEEGKQQIVQLRLSPNGLSVASTRLLDGSDAAATSIAALDLLEDDFFYLMPGEPQASIRRIRLK